MLVCLHYDKFLFFGYLNSFRLFLPLMLNAFELYRQLKEEEIVLAFKGAMTEDLLSSVFQMLEQKKEDDAIEARRIKKLNNILVECLQNIYHHGEDLSGQEGGDSNNSVVFLLCKNSNHKYRIITGNHMPTAAVASLKEKIDKVNGMNAEELKTYYREVLSSNELSEKGGAGLGIIDLVRKSGNKMEYRFDTVNEQFSFFSMIVNME